VLIWSLSSCREKASHHGSLVCGDTGPSASRLRVLSPLCTQSGEMVTEGEELPEHSMDPTQ
jgi:hypothetical protein